MKLSHVSFMIYFLKTNVWYQISVVYLSFKMELNQSIYIIYIFETQLRVKISFRIQDIDH